MYTIEHLSEELGRSPWACVFDSEVLYPEKFEITRRERKERRIYGHRDIPRCGKVIRANGVYKVVDVVEHVAVPDHQGSVDITIGRYSIKEKVPIQK